MRSNVRVYCPRNQDYDLILIILFATAFTLQNNIIDICFYFTYIFDFQSNY